MISITIPAGELYDFSKDEFISIKDHVLLLEHSLVSIAKWESKWEKPFLGEDKKTKIEIIDYIRCMTITQNVDPVVYNFITDQNIEDVSKYIEAPMTATWFSERNTGPVINKEIVTAEIIYYWMITFNIPVEFQKWHLNRLLTLIKVCSIKNAPKEKMKKSEILSKYKALNKARKAALHTNG